MALKGIKVIEMAGLAPGPMCGMILSDFGARVIRVDRADADQTVDTLSRGKESIALNMKHPSGKSVMQKLCHTADVLIEPFRPGVMEKLGLGPDILLKENPRLVYARLTGYGQTGPMSMNAGHDINYLALSGVLSRLGRKHENPYAPINLLADFAGGGALCALGITMALFERSRSGLGQVIDSSMVEGSAYIGSFLWSSRNLYIWGNERGENFLDGGAHFYETFKTKDGKYMSVGAIEPQFYDQLIKGLGLSESEAPQFGDSERCKKIFEERFASKTREEWENIFKKSDACVAPVLEMDEAEYHEHNKYRKSFLHGDSPGTEQPAPSPHLSRTPANVPSTSLPDIGQHSMKILSEEGYSSEDIKQLKQDGVFKQANLESKL